MKAVVTVTGKDKVGIIAMASAECAKFGVNIVDISQTVMKEYFAMIMLVELDGLNCEFSDFVTQMKKTGEENGIEGIRIVDKEFIQKTALTDGIC